MCHEDANNEGLPSPPAIFVVGTIGKRVGKCRVRGCIIFLASQIMSYTFWIAVLITRDESVSINEVEEPDWLQQITGADVV